MILAERLSIILGILQILISFYVGHIFGMAAGAMLLLVSANERQRNSFTFVMYRRNLVFLLRVFIIILVIINFSSLHTEDNYKSFPKRCHKKLCIRQDILMGSPMDGSLNLIKEWSINNPHIKRFRIIHDRNDDLHDHTFIHLR